MYNSANALLRKQSMELIQLLKKFNFKFRRWFPAIILAVIAAGFEGISFVFLVPMMNGIIRMKFDFVYGVPFVGRIVEQLPKIPLAPKLTIFIYLLILTFSAAILKNIFQYSASVSFAYQIRKFANDMRKTVFNRYLTFGKQFFDQNNVGYLNGILSGFTSLISNQLAAIAFALPRLLMLIIYVIVMLGISRKLTVLVVLIFPVLNFSLAWLIKKIEKTSKAFSDASISLNKKIMNTLTCIPLVKAYSKERWEERQFGVTSHGIQNLEFNMDQKQCLIAPIQEMITLSGLLLLVAVTALIFIKGHQGSIGSYMVFFLIMRRASFSFGILNDIKSAIAIACGPVREVLKVFTDEGKYLIPDGTKEFQGLKQEIRFNHLNFYYTENVQILDDISCSIEKGKTTAIVGPSGAGKSTLIHLIPRFYDTAPNSILIDGTDLRAFTLESLRSKIAMVSQDQLLFNDTIRANIAYGLENISEDRLTDVIKKSRLYDFVMNLPARLDTLIGDRGMKLSGGEKQRFSIARAFLKGVDILILDEATSSLDTVTEQLIQEAIEELTKGKTVIVIAHRFSTIKNADKIIVIDSGRVVEEGSLNDLLARKQHFYQLWEAQKFD